jgi:ATP-dependent RNA helicase DHX33
MYEVATHHVHAAVDDYIESAAKSVLQIHCRKGAEGDVLVFMPGTLTSTWMISSSL